MGTLEVQVVDDETDQLIHIAFVEIQGINDSFVLAGGSTDELGVYSVDLELGNYEINVSKSDYQDATTENVIVTPNSFVQVGIRLESNSESVVCGNNNIDSGEQCDDGKHCDNGNVCTINSECFRPDRLGDDVCIPRSGDGCSNTCESENVCGNDICEEGEDSNTCPQDCGEVFLQVSLNDTITTTSGLEINYFTISGDQVHAFLYILKTRTESGVLISREFITLDGLGFEVQSEDGLTTLEFLSINGDQEIDIKVTTNSFTEIISGKPDSVVNTAVIIAKPPGYDDPDIPFLEQNLQTAKEALEEMSYGELTFDWQITGVHIIDDPSGDIVKKVVEAANDEIDFTNIDLVIVVIEGGGAIGGIGPPAQTVQGELTLAVIMSPPGVFQHGDSWGVILHEYGHIFASLSDISFGAGHSNRLTCPIDQLIDIDTCGGLEYGDFYDVLGASSFGGHYNSVLKEMFGWLDNRIITVNQSGVFTIYPYELANSSPVVLKIFRRVNSQGQDEFFYIEYRTPQGFDEKVMGPYLFDSNPVPENDVSAINGPQIRIAPLNLQNSGISHVIDLIENADDVYGFRNIGLVVGENFTDPLTGISITTLEITDQQTTLDIFIPGSD